MRQEGARQGRKVYIGVENQPPAPTRHSGENKNTLNTRPDIPQKRPAERHSHQDYELDEEGLMGKVSRINRMNEEINSRLQRILTAIDSI